MDSNQWLAGSSQWAVGRLQTADWRLAITLLLALALSGCGLATRPVSVQVGASAPAFTLSTLDGKPSSLAEWRGETVLVNFWASWCPPCRDEMPAIEQVFQEHRGDLIVLAINQDQNRETTERFAQADHLTFPTLLDTTGSVAQLFRVKALPTSFFIDRAGVIRAIVVGEMSDAMIERHLANIDGK